MSSGYVMGVNRHGTRMSLGEVMEECMEHHGQKDEDGHYMEG